MAADLKVPYFRQMDNIGGEGYRQCASSACAMLAAYHQRVRTDDEYNIVREKYGDTTEIDSHLQALKALKLKPWFYTRANWATVEAHLALGRPCAVPYLHRGTVGRPTGFGHWAVAIGITRDTVIIHDPMGEPDMVNGGHIPGRSGKAVACTRRNYGRRWMVEGVNSGWLLTVLV